MKDKELRKLMGSRAKQRRLELNLTQATCWQTEQHQRICKAT